MTGLRWKNWALAVVVLTFAALVYRPERRLPFDLWDFPEFLPILRNHSGLWSGYGALLEYYASHGRMNALFYFTFAAQYFVFGEHAHLWQLARFAMMGLATLLAMRLARKLGIGRGGALVLGVLLVAATPMVRGWVQLMAEPMALVLLLLGVHLALGVRGSEGVRKGIVAIAVLTLALFLTKEIVGVLGLAVLWIAATRMQAPVHVRHFLDRRWLALTGLVGAVAVVVAVLLVLVRSGEAASGYGMAYGAAPLTLGRLVDNVAAIIVVVRPGRDIGLAALYPGNVLVLLGVLLGMSAYLRRGGSMAQVWLTIGTVAMVVMLGALVYLPWPKFDSFYALPFFVAPALAVAAGFDELWRAGGGRRIVAMAMTLALMWYLGVSASRTIETARASLLLNEQLAHLVSRMAASDTVMVIGPAELHRQMPVRSMELEGYAAMLKRIPVGTGAALVDARCDQATELLQETRLGLLTYAYGCGRLPGADLQIISTYGWRDWLTGRLQQDTLRAQIAGAPIRRLLSPSVAGTVLP